MNREPASKEPTYRRNGLEYEPPGERSLRRSDALSNNPAGDPHANRQLYAESSGSGSATIPQDTGPLQDEDDEDDGSEADRDTPVANFKAVRRKTELDRAELLSTLPPSGVKGAKDYTDKLLAYNLILMNLNAAQGHDPLNRLRNAGRTHARSRRKPIISWLS
ncbi:uncharacterized protein BDZ99DRAFT_517820 [Mytilinidion resinicola]|uniref:Uncharacterized protein n=1 Tax=Mytilinidion resinicola TaxID=574789 RepID=A0A6A6YZY7_9PEZI|nr:uncharacterized protein BDZ99DRAFT_517820 [Mytilinidion resinicola]KAF2813574.1 hypothetical protein BDZ99DRAFT_517820 [Mytilinidion resinicola]